MAKFTDVTFPDEISRGVHEHEIMFSFNNDGGAVAFYEWWHSEGSETFNEWCRNSDVHKDEACDE